MDDVGQLDQAELLHHFGELNSLTPKATGSIVKPAVTGHIPVHHLPSAALTDVFQFLESSDLPYGRRVIDFGCGAGRNSLYLAKQGFSVTSVDPKAESLATVLLRASETALQFRIHTVKSSLCGPLPLADKSFDLAIDSASTSALSLPELVAFESELWRVLHPGGYFMTSTAAEDDGYLAPRIDRSGMAEEPGAGMVRTTSRKQLEQLYARWQILDLAKRRYEVTLSGRSYRRSFWWLIARRPRGA